MKDFEIPTGNAHRKQNGPSGPEYGTEGPQTCRETRTCRKDYFSFPMTLSFILRMRSSLTFITLRS